MFLTDRSSPGEPACRELSQLSNTSGCSLFSCDSLLYCFFLFSSGSLVSVTGLCGSIRNNVKDNNMYFISHAFAPFVTSTWACEDLAIYSMKWNSCLLLSGPLRSRTSSIAGLWLVIQINFSRSAYSAKLKTWIHDSH